MNTQVFARTSLLIFCVVLCGCSQISIPTKSAITVINICSGRHDCNNGKLKIEDPESISQVIDALAPFQDGWQTENQMALTTGWFTYPTPEDSVGFRDRYDKSHLVIWFGVGWMGARVDHGDNRGTYFRKVSAEEVKPLRAALRITLRSTGPAPKAAS